MATFPDNYIDLTVTSPPYDNLRDYNGYAFDFEGIAKQLYRITKDGGVVVWVVNDATVNGSETGTSFKQALYFKDMGFNLHDTMIYAKPGFSAVGALATRYAPVFEYMFILTKGKLKTFNPIMDRKCKTAGSKKAGTIRQKDGTMKSMSNVGWVQPEYGQRFNIWEINPQSQGQKHPAPFPEQLANDHIISWSNEGDLILDPMCGSGTTCKMAMVNNRNYIGIDVSEEYCEIARKRIAEHEQQLALLGASKLQMQANHINNHLKGGNTMSKYTVFSLLEGVSEELETALLLQDWQRVEVAKEQVDDAVNRIYQMIDLATKLYNEGGVDV